MKAVGYLGALDRIFGVPATTRVMNRFRARVLPYDVVRAAASPDDALLAFLETTYAAAAELGRWERTALERGADPQGAG
jgi:hypothetical protein